MSHRISAAPWASLHPWAPGLCLLYWAALTGQYFASRGFTSYWTLTFPPCNLRERSCLENKVESDWGIYIIMDPTIPVSSNIGARLNGYLLNSCCYQDLGETKALIPSQPPESCPSRESLKSRVGIFIKWKQCKCRHSLLLFTGSHWPRRQRAVTPAATELKYYAAAVEDYWNSDGTSAKRFYRTPHSLNQGAPNFLTALSDF